MNKSINSKKGFTLVELLVVIAILGILATIGITSYSSYTKKAKITKNNYYISEVNHYISSVYALNDNINGLYDIVAKNDPYILPLNSIELINENDHIGFDTINKEIIYIDESTNIDESNKPFILLFIDDISKIDNNSNYGYYLTTSKDYENASITIKTSIDINNSTNLNITTSNDTITNINIYTNNYKNTITIDSSNKTINHYGYSKSINVSNGILNEYGSVFKLVNSSNTINTKSNSNIVVNSENEITTCFIHTFVSYTDKVDTYDVCSVCGYSKSNVCSHAFTHYDETYHICIECGTKVSHDAGTTCCCGYSSTETKDFIVIGTSDKYNFDVIDTTTIAANSTIKLLKDITLDSFLTLSKNLTIDLNGFTLNTNSLGFTGTNLIIKDSSDYNKNGSGNGKISCSNSNTINLNNSSSTIKLESGLIENTYSSGISVNVQCGSFVMNGGAVSGINKVINTRGNLTINNGNIISTGNSFSPIIILAGTSETTVTLTKCNIYKDSSNENAYYTVEDNSKITFTINNDNVKLLNN